MDSLVVELGWSRPRQVENRNSRDSVEWKVKKRVMTPLSRESKKSHDPVKQRVGKSHDSAISLPETNTYVLVSGSEIDDSVKWRVEESRDPVKQRVNFFRKKSRPSPTY